MSPPSAPEPEPKPQHIALGDIIVPPQEPDVPGAPRQRGSISEGRATLLRLELQLADALRKCKRFGAVNPETAEPGKGGGFTISAELVGVQPFAALAGRGRAWR